MPTIESDKNKNIWIPRGIWALALISGLVLPPGQTISAWQSLMQEIDRVDDEFDKAPDRQKVITSTLERLETNPPEFLGSCSTRHKDQFKKLLIEQFNISHSLSAASDPARYAELSLEDGAFLTNFFILLIPETYSRKHPKSVIRFQKRLAWIAGVYNLRDNMKDLDEDRKNGEIAVTNLDATRKALQSRLRQQFIRSSTL